MTETKTKRAVRTDLTQAEWIRMKLAATTRGMTVEKWASEQLRAGFNGGKS